MDWIQFILFGVATLGMFFWNRTESRTDTRHMESLLREMKDEMKDFHARLCVLEERYLQIITRKDS